MKCKFLSLSILLTAISFTQINAKCTNISQKSGNGMISKSKSEVPYYRASDTSIITISGTGPDFTRLSFNYAKRKFLNGISPSENNKSFILEKGSYQINFTGVFTNNSSQSGVELAVKVGTELYSLKNQVIDDTDFTRTISTYQLFHFSESTKISIVARNTIQDGSFDISQRTISIRKLS